MTFPNFPGWTGSLRHLREAAEGQEISANSHGAAHGEPVRQLSAMRRLPALLQPPSTHPSPTRRLQAIRMVISPTLMVLKFPFDGFCCSSICGKLSSNRTTWRQHELTHMDKETRMLKETNEHRSKTASRSLESHQPAPSLFAFARPPGLITYEKRASAPKARKTSKSKQLCPKCGQVFFQGGNVLFDHVSRCNGTPAEKRRGYNYPCVHCERKFNAKTKCARHMLEVHQRHIENIEKFCFQCNREVEEPFAHAKSHNCPFKCQEVSGKFIFNKAALQHIPSPSHHHQNLFLLIHSAAPDSSAKKNSKFT